MALRGTLNHVNTIKEKQATVSISPSLSFQQNDCTTRKDKNGITKSGQNTKPTHTVHLS